MGFAMREKKDENRYGGTVLYRKKQRQCTQKWESDTKKIIHHAHPWVELFSYIIVIAARNICLGFFARRPFFCEMW